MLSIINLTIALLAVAATAQIKLARELKLHSYPPTTQKIEDGYNDYKFTVDSGSEIFNFDNDQYKDLHLAPVLKNGRGAIYYTFPDTLSKVVVPVETISTPITKIVIDKTKDETFLEDYKTDAMVCVMQGLNASKCYLRLIDAEFSQKQMIIFYDENEIQLVLLFDNPFKNMGYDFYDEFIGQSNYDGDSFIAQHINNGVDCLDTLLNIHVTNQLIAFKESKKTFVEQKLTAPSLFSRNLIQAKYQFKISLNENVIPQITEQSLNNNDAYLPVMSYTDCIKELTAQKVNIVQPVNIIQPVSEIDVMKVNDASVPEVIKKNIDINDELIKLADQRDSYKKDNLEHNPNVNENKGNLENNLNVSQNNSDLEDDLNVSQNKSDLDDDSEEEDEDNELNDNDEDEDGENELNPDGKYGDNESIDDEKEHSQLGNHNENLDDSDSSEEGDEDDNNDANQNRDIGTNQTLVQNEIFNLKKELEEENTKNLQREEDSTVPVNQNELETLQATETRKDPIEIDDRQNLVDSVDLDRVETPKRTEIQIDQNYIKNPFETEADIEQNRFVTQNSVDAHADQTESKALNELEVDTHKNKMTVSQEIEDLLNSNGLKASQKIESLVDNNQLGIQPKLESEIDLSKYITQQDIAEDIYDDNFEALQNLNSSIIKTKSDEESVLSQLGSEHDRGDLDDLVVVNGSLSNISFDTHDLEHESRHTNLTDHEKHNPEQDWIIVEEQEDAEHPSAQPHIKDLGAPNKEEPGHLGSAGGKDLKFGSLDQTVYINKAPVNDYTFKEQLII